MGFYKKTVLLSNQSNYDFGMAILTIEQNNGGVFGSLKAFDLPSQNNLILGISVDGKQVIKQNIAFLNGNIFSFKLNNDFEINGKIGCVLCEVGENKVKPIIWGTNGFQAEYKKDIIHIIEKDKLSTLKQNLTNEDQYTAKVAEVNEKFKEKTNQSIEIKINKEEQLINECNAKLFETTDEEVEELIDTELNKTDDFYGLISEQIDELFKKFPEELKLSNIIPNSKWVKVDYDNNGKDYVLGLIYNNSEIQYICYGVPGDYDNLPPEELQQFSQWIPVENRTQKGYWLMFQDAITGDSVVVDKINFS